MSQDGLREVSDVVAEGGATRSASELVEQAGVLFAEDRFDEARRALEGAFGGFRAAGEMRAAARVAAQLADLHGGPLGNDAMARGWDPARSAIARRL